MSASSAQSLQVVAAVAWVAAGAASGKPHGPLLAAVAVSLTAVAVARCDVLERQSLINYGASVQAARV